MKFYSKTNEHSFFIEIIITDSIRKSSGLIDPMLGRFEGCLSGRTRYVKYKKFVSSEIKVLSRLSLLLNVLIDNLWSTLHGLGWVGLGLNMSLWNHLTSVFSVYFNISNVVQ